MRSIIVTAALLAATPAQACIRSSLAYTFEDRVSNELAYLICLHNEQTEAIDALSDELRRKDISIQLLQREIESLGGNSSMHDPVVSNASDLPVYRQTPGDQKSIDSAIEGMRKIIEDNAPPKR